MQIIEYYRMIRRKSGRHELLSSEEAKDMVAAIQMALDGIQRDLLALKKKANSGDAA